MIYLVVVALWELQESQLIQFLQCPIKKNGTGCGKRQGMIMVFVWNLGRGPVSRLFRTGIVVCMVVIHAELLGLDV